MKKNIGIGISLLLVVAVAAGIYKSAHDKQVGSATAHIAQDAVGQPVRLLAGSAKFGFLKDPELVAILEKEGLRLDLVKSGSFDQDKSRANEFDGVWPAGANTAADWAQLMAGATTYPVFSTPLALATWKSLVPVFEKNGLAKITGPVHGDFYLEKALPLMLNGTRWNQLKDNDVFAFNKGFLVNTPDIRKSATGLQYIAALAYIQNGNDVPQDAGKATALADQLSPLITRQGFQEGTLSGPFEDYLGQGMGKAPLVLIYESQFIEAKRDQKLRDVHVLLYPQPGLVLKHVFVGRTAAGKRLGEILSTNPGAQRIAARYGFRTNDPNVFAAEAKKIGLDAPELLNLAETPSTSVLDAMNQAIIRKLEGTQ